MSFKSNISQVEGFYKELARDMKPQVLTMENSAEYARNLQDKKGFYVFSDEVSVRFVRRSLSAAGAFFPMTPENVQKALEAAGFLIVGFLRGLTSKSQPSIRKGEGIRQAHPGGWADRTGLLSAATRFRVNRNRWRAGGR